ncbi:nucleotidyltransferase domain-containing protein, partial [Herminiimonas fonticola]|uniref:[protein-PII] uridylyltransferase family protein n=1 Tax=Herminiimonas fonticola TaxID=303380 RepID=UPI003342C2F7
MPPLAHALKEQLKAERQTVIDRFLADGKAEQLLTQLKNKVDAALSQAWTSFELPPTAALIAVGGYGRGELFPYSDVDVLILLHEHPDAALQAKLEELIQLFWDLGLEIGHSIRTIDECLSEAAADITVQTSLLEARLIMGDSAQFQLLKERCDAAMDPQAFFQAKTLELRQRHAKYEDTPYSLEPNCKESPGGLRDLQVILWVAKAAGLG